MRRAITAAPWVLFACGVLVAHFAPSPVAAAPSSAAAPVAASDAECVDVEAQPGGSGMAIRIHNGCTYDVRCEVSWSVRCEGDDAVKASKRHNFDLTSGGDRHLLASGEACGDAIWEIGDEAWECVQQRR
ncbi:MAG: hypothetical protein KC420_13085 [Myxococcales bacterium]|nr:hypothetical protein [Myxococcales bacterium]MCB9701354.1 hypothetical protein [Myxococcales bacterium]